MGVKLFLIRHGQTKSNVEGKYQGSIDSVLTPLGIKQAVKARKYLSRVKFSNIYSSNLKRTIQSAEIIARGSGLEVKKRKNLREINFGKWEGMKFEQINIKYRRDYQNWLSDPYKNPPTDGESFGDVINRADLEVKKIISENYDGSSVAIITHGGVILALIVNWLRIPSECWRSLIQRQGAINVVVINDGFPYISSINYTGHLKPLYDASEDMVIEIYSKIKERNDKN